MLPLTIKQQKFAKISQVMQPEINKIQRKYRNKTDQASMMKQNEEIQKVYEKGLQRRIRHAANNPPFNTPCFSIASIAYCEQVGVYIQVALPLRADRYF